MSEIDNYLNSLESNDKPSAKKDKSSSFDSEIASILESAPTQDKGFGGAAKDFGLSLAKGVIGVPEALVGLADIPAGGKVGKFLENEDGLLGFRPKQAKEFLSEFHTDKFKEQQQEFADADGIAGKTIHAIKNPSLITGTLAESAPSIGLGGVYARGLGFASKGLSGVARGGIGEGAVMAGQQASEIRGETEDGLLTGKQAGLSLATGTLGTLFGIGGASLARKLGIGDVDTMLAKGLKPEQVAAEIASMPAKSIPRKVIEGMITEGFLEELPQSVSEQILQNLALDKDWSEGVEDAAVMGTLAGMAMGGGAAFAGRQGATQADDATTIDGNAPIDQQQFEAEAPQYDAWGDPIPKANIDIGQMEEGGVTPAPIFDTQDIDRNLAPTPSQQMGINPDDGPLSAAAAQSVDSGLFAGGFTPQAGINQSALEREGVTPPPVLDADQIDRNLGSIDPITGEYIPAPELLDQPSRAGSAGNYEYDQWGNLSKVDGRAVEGYGQDQPRLGFNNRPERSAAPSYEVGPDGVARPTTGEKARSMKERVDLSSLGANQKQAAPKQQAQQPAAQRTPEQDAQSIWDNLNTFERNAAATKVLGMRGVPAKNTATKAWGKLSPKQQAKLTAGLDAQQGQRWTDPNQKVADQTGPVLQNRDRTSQDSINQMRGISNNPDYSRLKTSGFLSDGAPVAIDENIKVPASQLGVTDTASAGGKKFNVQYAVVEADQFLTSNSIDGTPNTEYAAGSTDKARAIAGNGRITGLQSAWAKGKADQYKADMAADKMHGIDAAVIEGMKNPILVRLLPQDEVTDNIGDLSNRDEKGKLSPVEQAKTDMGRIDLDSLKFTADGAIGGEAIHQFRMAQPAAERVSEAEARKRLTSAIFQKAYGNDQLTEIQSGESDDAKSILSALAQAAPSMSRLEGAGEFDVRPLITQAGIAAVNAARRGTKLADYVQQSEMGIDPMVYPILEMMLNEHGNIRSSKYIGEQLTNMAKLAYDEANSPSSDMFGEKPKRTAEQVIQDALTGVQGYGQINDGRGQESLGQRGRSEPDAQMVEGPEGGRERPADTKRTAPAQPEAEQGQPATVENEVPEKWRTNYLRAAKVARDLGIDPKQHKKLADLVAAIDAFNAEPVAQQGSQAPTLDLTQQTEETLAAEAERLEQLQKEEAAQKAKQKAAESKARERDADKARADEVVDDFQLGQSAEEVMSGMGDIFATESNPSAAVDQSIKDNIEQISEPAKRPSNYGSDNKLVSSERADELRKRLQAKLFGQLNSGFDPEILAIGAELAAFHIEAGARKFAAFAKAIAQDLGTTPYGLRKYLRSWYNGARDMMEDSDISIDGMDSPDAVRESLKEITGSAETKEPAHDAQQRIAQRVLKEVAKDGWQDDAIKKREMLAALYQDGYSLDTVMSELGVDSSEANTLNNASKIIDYIYQDADNVKSTAASTKQNSAKYDASTDERSILDDSRGEVRRPASKDGKTAGQAEQKASDAVDNSSNTATGKPSNKPVSSEKSRLENEAAGSIDDSRSMPDSTGGLYADRKTGGVVSEGPGAAPTEVKKLNLKATSKASNPDLDEVKSQMPFLTDGQAQDVVFAEKRLSKDNGYGVLFTNGTGTGKTFTGLGIVKRMIMRGKKNILILAPKQTITRAWIDAGKDFFNIDISALKDTNDAGEGVVVTTYANLGDNNALMRRDWDAVVADEAHYLSSAQTGKDTSALKKLRAMTLKNNTARDRVLALNPELNEEMKALYADAETNRKSDNQILWDRAVEQKEKADEISKQLKQMVDKEKARIEAIPSKDAPRAVFLSATPFAYEKSVSWANEFLFDWGTTESSGAYNSADGYESFMMQHFGYRMRYNKLTAPDAKVDSGLMQRSFNTWLKKEGVLSGRALDSDFDYDRKFVHTENAIGRRVDEAIEWLRENSEISGVSELYTEMITDNFDYHQRMYFLEAIKASESIPIIKDHLALGRKVVVIHDFKKGGASNPFKLKPQTLNSEVMQDAYQLFKDNFPDLIGAFDSMPSPIDQLLEQFPEALVYNGDVSAKKRVEMQDQFNDDSDSAPRLIIAQGDAMREGVSIHDRTGKHPRVMISLGMPVRSIAAMQLEGRTYRTGQASNAMFRYLTIGSNWERFAFASTIATRASAAENLAMGEEARGLKDAFINSYENADAYPAGFEGEGVGGKAEDASYASEITAWDKAKALYYGTKQQGRGRSASGREHSEFFATPEPLGLKMVQWADIKAGEKTLEPSAGHGAIARWLPDNTENRAIEFTNELSSRLALHFNGDLQTGDFLQHHIINKYDAIVMNPPFGRGGIDAAAHVGKAIRHLNDGGRIVALIPNGPAADKRFDALLESDEAKDIYLVSEIILPSSVFERAGTNVSTRVIVLERQLNPDNVSKLQQSNKDYSSSKSVDDFFNSIEDSEINPRVEVVKPKAPEAEKSDSAAETWEAKHSKTNDNLYMAKPNKKLSRDEYNSVAAIAKQNDGYWSRFGKAGFLFKTEADRQAFISEAFKTDDAPQFSKAPKTDTEAFKKFFGKSKVTDNSGRPLAVYHGSPDVRGIFSDGFRAGMRGQVFFAAADYSVANSYADDSRAFDYQNAEPQTIPLYLSIQNPMVVDAKGKHWRETEKYIKEAKDAGHDGIIIKNSVDFYNNPATGGKATTVYAWFNPVQAKSALDAQLRSRIDGIPIEGAVENNGAFSLEDDRISYSQNKPQRAAQGITKASLIKSIAANYPKQEKAVRKMLERGEKGLKGGAVIINSANQNEIAKVYAEKTGRSLLKSVQIFSDAGQINGFYDKQSGLIFLVAPNLNTTTAPAVLFHEVVHSQQRSEIDARSMKLINGRGKEKNADLKAFLETVSQRMIDAGEDGNALESTSYIVEQAVMEGRSQGYTLADSKFLNAIEKTLGSTVANIIRDFTKMVRQFALRHGLPIKVTIDDLVQYAMASVEQAGRGNVDGGVQFSKNATEDRPEGRRQFEETEKAYGGRAAYDQAKSEGKTKLNYQQWVQVRTPAFKDWFGDWENAGRERIDKARHVRRAQAGYKQEAAADTREAGGREDRNRVGAVLYGAGTLMDLETGEPRVFYHGTSEDIKAFNLNHPTRKDSGWLGRGVYVASDVRMANTYANTKNGSAAPNVMPVFIRSTSGLYQATLSDKQVGSGLSQENIDKATEALKQRGYDGAYLEFQSDSTIELVTYSVNNVKSASGNVGTFSAATDDISFSRSQTKTAAFKKQFGDSKVVDASGDPLLVYHGSGAKFATFDKNKRGATTRAKSAEEGFFFTSSKSLAYDFKKQAEGAAADLDAIRGAVEGLSDSQLESLASDIGRIASEDLDLEGRDFFIDSLMDMYQHDTDINTWPEESNGTPKALKNYIPKDILEPGAIHDIYLRIENPHEHVFDEDDDWHDEGAITRAISTAQKNGNDGVILRNMVDVARADEKGNNAIRSDVYIAFEPDQIIQSEDSAGIRFSRAANPASVNAAPNGMAAWDSPSASKFDDFVYKIQDKHVDTKRVIAAIRDTGKAISDDLDVYLQETLFHGRAAKRTQDFLNKEVNPLIEYMQSAKVDMSDLEEFLHARHAQEANALIAKRDPNLPDGGSGMTNAEAAKYLNSLNGVRRKQFENAAKMVDKIIGGTRETIVDYGLESQDTVDGWANGFKHYIPLQREDKDGQMGIGQGFSVKGKETKSRTGSTRKVVDILANVMMQRERIIVRGEKNRVAVAALGLAKDNPLPDFWQVDKVPTTRVLDKTTGLVRNQADPMYKSRDNAIVAKVNGQEHAILMNEDDPRAMRMAEALKNLDAAQLEGLLGATATATRYFAAVNTQYNPIFGVTNFVRDIQEAMLHLQSTPLAGQQARLFKNTFTAVGAVMKAERDGRKGNNATGKWGVLWEDFQNTGGQTGFRDQFSSSADRGEAIKRALTPDGWADTGLGKLFTADGVLKAPLEAVRKKAAWMFDLLSDYNTAMENGVRLSAYETGINAGMSKEQAAALAKSLTVNFNRKGQVTQQVGALYAFFNASVQGSARLGQSLFDMEPGKPKTMRLSKLGKRIVSGGVLLGASQAVLLAMMGFDDDEPPEFIRERNIIIPTGGKTYISIPMPLGYHVIANLGRIPTEFALGGGEDAAKHLMSLMDVMADVYNPLGSSGLSMQTIAPTVLDPLAGLAENKDFAGRAIAKESFNRQTPGHALARDTASLPATWLSEAINYATGGTEFTRGELSPTPDQIDYLVGQLTGGVGRETTKFLQSSQAVATGDELPWHKIPLAGRFIGDADSDGAKQSAFYNNMDKVRKHAEEVKGLRASGRSSEAAEYANKYPHARLHLAARAAETQVKGMRDRKRELEQAGAPREEIRALEKRMIKRMEQFVELSAVRK